MPSDFNQCVKWKLETNEFVILANKSVRETYRNVTIPTGEYRVNEKRELFACVPTAAQPPFYYVDLVYASAWTVSVIFLIMSVTIQSIQSQDHRNRARSCHQSSLIAFYLTSLFYVITQSDYLMWYYFVKYFGTYANLSAFCWLTIINFENFGQLRPENVTTTTTTFTFRFQSLLAWSIPLIIIGFTSALRFFGVINSSGYLELNQNNAEVSFLHGSFDLMFVVNLIIFVMTVRNLYRYRKSIAESNRKIFRKISVVYLELMAVTGLNWIFFILDQTLTKNRASNLVWTSIDIVSGLQGFFIFLVYHCNCAKLRYCDLCSGDNSV